MYIKNALIFFLFIFPNIIFSQIKIDDVGDGWKFKVDSALSLIKSIDPENYTVITTYCKSVEFIISDRSTTKLPWTIAISTGDMKIGSINNIAAILIHESWHLKINKEKIKMDDDSEELLCYTKEYGFICKLPNVEDWLFKNTINQIIYYQSRLREKNK
jgi:hypothetical protein